MKNAMITRKWMWVIFLLKILSVGISDWGLGMHFDDWLMASLFHSHSFAQLLWQFSSHPHAPRSASEIVYFLLESSDDHSAKLSNDKWNFINFFFLQNLRFFRECFTDLFLLILSHRTSISYCVWKIYTERIKDFHYLNFIRTLK